MTANPPALLQATDLTQKFADSTAVDSLSITLQKGDVLGLLGLNGAGKSSTLRMLAGVLAPTSGKISINGHSLTDQPLAAKRAIGYLPEVPPLYPDMQVRDFLVFTARLRKVPSRQIKSAVDRLLAELNLGPQAKRAIGNLSKGFQQRVGLAQALIHDPALVILDEPSSGLDPEQMRELRDLIIALGRDRGIIFSSHMLGEVTEVCDRVLVLHEGRQVFAGPLSDTGDATADGTTRYSVRFKQPVNAATLSCISGVVQASMLDTQSGVIATHSGQQDILLANMVTAGLGVIEFGPERHSLEALFSSLITSTPVTHSHSTPARTARIPGT